MRRQKEKPDARGVRVRPCAVVDCVAVKLVGVLAGCRYEDYAESRTEFGATEESSASRFRGETGGVNDFQPVLRFLFPFPVSIHVVFRPVFAAVIVARIRARLGAQDDYLLGIGGILRILRQKSIHSA